MVQKMVVSLVDDLDGTSSNDISTVTFGLDGANDEIDLNDRNAEQLREGWNGSSRLLAGPEDGSSDPLPKPDQ